jgi:pilus assembly protein Flp/PilA
MRDALLKFYVSGRVLWTTLQDDNGQDLVEYALLVAIVALGAIVGMQSLATGINTAMQNLQTKFATYTGS